MSTATSNAATTTRPTPNDEQNSPGWNVGDGLSLRAYIAAKALAAIIGRTDIDADEDDDEGHAHRAQQSVAAADALIAALKTK